MDNDLADAREVGISFVSFFYDIMNKDPTRLHELYSDEAVFSYGTEGGSDETVKGISAVQNKIASLAYQSPRVEIRSLVTAPSVQSSIVVMTVGKISNAGRAFLRFTETFVLVRCGDASHYYVQTHVFRFLVADDKVVAPAQPAAAVTAPPATEQQNKKQQNKKQSQQQKAKAQTPPAQQQQQQQQPQQPAQQAPQQQQQQQQQPQQQQQQRGGQRQKQQVRTAPAPATEEPKKLSYASIASNVPVAGDSNDSSAPANDAAPPAQSAPANVAPAPTAAQNAASNQGAGQSDLSDGGQQQQGPADPCAIYVGNIPFTCTHDQLRNIFNEYGTVKNVDIPQQKGFGFVHFADPQAVAKIVSTKPEISLEGRRFVIDAKRARSGGPPQRGRGRGRGGNRGGNRGRPRGQSSFQN